MNAASGTSPAHYNLNSWLVSGERTTTDPKVAAAAQASLL